MFLWQQVPRALFIFSPLSLCSISGGSHNFSMFSPPKDFLLYSESMLFADSKPTTFLGSVIPDSINEAFESSHHHVIHKAVPHSIKRLLSFRFLFKNLIEIS